MLAWLFSYGFEEFWSFLFPVLEYFSSVWMFATYSNSSFLDYVISKAVKLSDCLVVCALEHICHIVAVCMFYKICCNPNHSLEVTLLRVRVTAMLTHLVLSVHSTLG